MLDQEYIKDIMALEDEKEAKTLLIEYAKSIGIKIIRNDIDKMKATLERKFNALNSMPMPEEPENGLTISDLIQADDELNGKSVLDESEAKPLAVEAIKNVATETPQETLVEEPQEKVEPVVVNIVKTVKEEPRKVELNIVLEKEVDEDYQLPDDFSPSIILMGKAPGYYTLPWWIYQWIEENPNWKQNPNKCPHYHALSILKSLLYYIKRDGSIMIRETRNSSFKTLT